MNDFFIFKDKKFFKNYWRKDLNEFIFIFSRYFDIINNYCYYFITITLLFYCSGKLF